MPTIETSQETIQTHPVHRVYVKEGWTDPDWILEPYLFCLQVTKAAAPDTSGGDFDWRYGRGIQHDQGEQDNYAPKDLGGWFVKVEIGPEFDQADPESVQPDKWWGVIQEADDDRQGALVVENVRVITGRQTLHAVGLEIFLRRHVIQSSWLLNETTAAEYEIHRGLKFNAENKRSNVGNRSLSRGSRGTYMFAHDLDAAAYWTTADVVEYLLEWHAPLNHLDAVTLPFTMLNVAGLPGWDRPRLDLHGKTLWDLLNELIDRGRFHGWRLDVVENQAPPDDAEITFFTFNENVINLPGGGVILGNGNDRQLDFDRALDVTRSPLKESIAHTFDEVVCQGGRIRACFSLSAQDSTLTSDWSLADELLYETGASGQAGYAGFDRDKQERLNALVRQADALSRVYASFKIPDAWDGRAGDGIGGAKTNVFLDESGAVDSFWRQGLRFLHHLPIKDTANSAAQEWLRPIALVKLPAHSGEPARYANLERLSDQARIEGEGDGAGFRWSASVSMADHDAATILRVSGKPQYVLASFDFAPLAEDAGQPAELDWRDNLIVTVFVEQDRFVSKKWPLALNVADVVRRLVIDLGDLARLDYVAAGTVTGVTAGGTLIQVGAAYYQRDDRQLLEDLARLIFEWHDVARQAFSLEVKQIFNQLAVGDLITQIGDLATQQSVNSVVTSVEWDLAGGQTLITTDFAEIDARRLL